MKQQKSVQIRELFNNANFLMKEKKWEEASEAWKEIRKLSPDRPAGYIQGAIALNELGLYSDAISLALDLNDRNSNVFILQILENIKSTDLYEKVFLNIVTEKFSKLETTAIVDRIHSLEVNNKNLYVKYIKMIKNLLNDKVNIDYFTLIALGIIERPDKNYISKLYKESNLNILKKVFSSKVTHTNNVLTLKELDIIDKHPNYIITNAFQEIYSEKDILKFVSLLNKKNKLKIALCISGQLRGYEKAYKSWGKFKFDNHEVDTYCCVWKNIGRKKVNKTHLYRMFNKNFINAFISFTEGITDKNVSNIFKNLYQYFEKPQDISLNEVKNFYSAKKCLVIDDDEFKDKTNMYKMHYMIEECWNLIANPEEYDLIIRFRPDKELISFENNWNHILEISKQNNLIVNGDGPFISAGIGFAIGDQFAVGIPKIMKEYSTTFSSINAEKGAFSKNLFPGFRAHMSLYLKMIDKRINVLGLEKVLFGKLLDPEKTKNEIIMELIKEDFKEDPKSKSFFLNAIKKDIKEERE